MSMTRAEHMRWCKSRAREYVNNGDFNQAVASMISDLGKHPETKGLVEMASMLALAALMNGDRRAVSNFVEGFAE